MALPNRYPLPQTLRREVHRTEDGRYLVLHLRAIDWKKVIEAMKLRAVERRAWEEELTVWLDK